MISIICPSRKRLDRNFETCKQWVERSGVDKMEIDLNISVDSDDPTLDDYKHMYSQVFYGVYSRFENNYNLVPPRLVINSNRSAVDAINNAANVCEGDIIIVVSDDFEAPENWASKLLEQTKGKTDWIAKTHDGIQKWIITLPIMDRAYYNRFGYIYHPDYLHMFCDTEITCVADLTGRKINLDIPFTHNHYSTGRSVKDEVSIKADATWNQGESLFLERAKRNFDLVNPTGKITSHEYINWMKTKGVSVQ